VAAVVALSLPALLFVRHFTTISRITNDTQTYQARVERFTNLPENAVIISNDDGRATRYKYFQLVRHLRPDVTIHTLGRLAPRFRESSGLASTGSDLVLGLNLADRLRILKGLLAESPERPHFTILDDRMPPELDHFRIRRSLADPRLLSLRPKPKPVVSLRRLPVDVASGTRADYGPFRITGFTLSGLDGGATRAFTSPLALQGREADGLIERSELFELSLIVRRTGELPGKLFAEVAFVNDRMEIPSAHGFVATRQMEIADANVPVGGERQSDLTFKIPKTVAPGFYTLAVRLSLTAETPAGTYRGKPVRSLRALQAPGAWRGQAEYVPLGTIWLE